MNFLKNDNLKDGLFSSIQKSVWGPDSLMNEIHTSNIILPSLVLAGEVWSELDSETVNIM